MSLQHPLTQQQHAPTCSSRLSSCRQACSCPQTRPCTNQQLYPPTLSLGLCAHIPLHKLYSRKTSPNFAMPFDTTTHLSNAVLWIHRCHCSCSIPVSPLLLKHPNPALIPTTMGVPLETASAAQHARTSLHPTSHPALDQRANCTCSRGVSSPQLLLLLLLAALPPAPPAAAADSPTTSSCCCSHDHMPRNLIMCSMSCSCCGSRVSATEDLR